MKLLLDTCTLLWFLTNDRKLSLRARTVNEDLKMSVDFHQRA